MLSPVEEIKKRVDIVDLVGSYVRLSKAGANFKAVCPFHNEKTPSFYVSPSREIFHCFGCNAGGDVFRFVSMIEGVEFPEALEMLAARAGVVLRKEDPRMVSERKRLLSLLQDAASFYQEELSKNKAASDYLIGRGVLEESIKSFKLGFAPDSWDGVLNYLKQKGYKAEEVTKAGLVIPGQSLRFYDRFRSRIMFPIADLSGRIVGFSGRIFNKETNEGKYINSPQTVLYDKSRILYLWDRAKNDIRKEGAAILVEGQMDALMSHQAGVKNVVATSGTALGREHVKTIKRLASKVLFAFDSDDPGMAASRRGIDIAYEEGMDVHVIRLDQKDPADLIKQNPSQWALCVKNSSNHIQFILESLKSRFGHDKVELLKEMQLSLLPYLKLINNDIIRSHWIQETSKSLAIKEESVWDELKKMAPKKDGKVLLETKPSDIARKTRRQLVEERIIGMAAWHKDKLPLGFEEKLLGQFSRENLPILAAVSGGRASEDIQARLAKLSLEAELLYGDEADLGKELSGLFSELEREVAKGRLEFLSEEIRKAELTGEKELLSEYLNEFQNISKKLNHLWQESRLKK